MLQFKFNYYKKIVKHFGWGAVFFLIKSKFRLNKLENIYIKGIKYPITLSNYSTDVSTLFKIFFAKDYAVDLESSDFIIDCGANIGLSAIFFASRYPAALIVAIEPDKENFKYLCRNAKDYNNIICLNMAVWSSNSEMKLVDEGKGNWAIKTIVAEKTDRNIINGIAINQILLDFKKEKIDLIKIDIEGAEKELFSYNYHWWLSKTSKIAIELHESPDNIITKTFYNAINAYNFKEYQKGENTIIEFL
jgi:FkbM family methyltransferase